MLSDVSPWGSALVPNELSLALGLYAVFADRRRRAATFVGSIGDAEGMCESPSRASSPELELDFGAPPSGSVHDDGDLRWTLFHAKAEEVVNGSRAFMAGTADDGLAAGVAQVCALSRRVAVPRRAVECALVAARVFDHYVVHSADLRKALEYCVRAAVEALVDNPHEAYPQWMHWLQSREPARVGSKSWPVVVAGLCSYVRDTVRHPAVPPARPTSAPHLQRQHTCCLVLEMLHWLAAHGTVPEQHHIYVTLRPLVAGPTLLHPQRGLAAAPLLRAAAVQVLETMAARSAREDATAHGSDAEE